MRLAFENVAFSFHAERAALEGVSFELPAGAVAGVVGPNGAGKSTLARLAAGLLRPAAGTVRLGAESAAALPPRERARRVAFLPQGPDVRFPVRALDLVLGGRYPHVGAFRGETAEDFAIARASLDRAGAAGLAGRDVATLSGGERQRVFLARALAQRAPILVADEPTLHLDLAHVEALAELFRSLAGTLSLLVVSHDLDLIARLAPRVLVLDAGRLVADGGPDDVLDDARLSATFGVRVERPVDRLGRRRLLLSGGAGTPFP